MKSFKFSQHYPAEIVYTNLQPLTQPDALRNEIYLSSLDKGQDIADLLPNSVNTWDNKPLVFSYLAIAHKPKGIRTLFFCTTADEVKTIRNRASGKNSRYTKIGWFRMKPVDIERVEKKLDAIFNT